MKKATMLIAIALSSLGCSAVPDGDAGAACLSIFDAFDRATVRCGSATPPPRSICDRAFGYDAEELKGCVAWLGDGPCDGFTNEAFQAHCGTCVWLRDL